LSRCLARPVRPCRNLFKVYILYYVLVRLNWFINNVCKRKCLHWSQQAPRVLWTYYVDTVMLHRKIKYTTRALLSAKSWNLKRLSTSSVNNDFRPSGTRSQSTVSVAVSYRGRTCTVRPGRNAPAENYYPRRRPRTRENRTRETDGTKSRKPTTVLRRRSFSTPPPRATTDRMFSKNPNGLNWLREHVLPDDGRLCPHISNRFRRSAFLPFSESLCTLAYRLTVFPRLLMFRNRT
jgi:hypothetical protein